MKEERRFNRKFKDYPGGVYLKATDKPATKQDFIDFAEQARKAERNRILEALPGEAKHNPITSATEEDMEDYNLIVGFNTCLSQIKDIIKKR